jgi:hypothetical protein
MTCARCYWWKRKWRDHGVCWHWGSRVLAHESCDMFRPKCLTCGPDGEQSTRTGS